MSREVTRIALVKSVLHLRVSVKIVYLKRLELLKRCKTTDQG